MKKRILEQTMGRRPFVKCLLAVCSIATLGHGGAVFAAEDSTALSRWNSMTPEQKETIKKRWADFKAMKPEEKKEIVDSYQAFMALSEDQRKTIEKNYEHWKTLSKEEQDAISKRYAEWKNLTEEQRSSLTEQLKGGSDATKSAK